MDDKTVIQKMDKTVLLRMTEKTEKRPIKGWLTVWSGVLKGNDYPLGEGRNFVGSDKKCHVFLSDIHINDFLFNIRIKGDTWTLIDLDSDDGILVDDEPVFRKELADENWIKAAQVLFRIKKR